MGDLAAPPPVPVTQLRSQTKALTIGILTLPVFGIGVIILLAIAFTNVRSGPCPHCTAVVRLRDGERVTHDACGKDVQRRGELVYAL